MRRNHRWTLPTGTVLSKFSQGWCCSGLPDTLTRKAIPNYTPSVRLGVPLQQVYRHFATGTREGGEESSEPLELEVQFEGEGKSTDWKEETTSTAVPGKKSTGPESFKDLKGTTISTLDNYVSSRVAMCLKRINGAAAGAIRYQVTKLAKDTDSGKSIHKAQAAFIVHGSPQRAIGYALGDPKEAEIACATHIERLLDNLGVPMFQLSRKQEAHVAAAAADGRYAPAPGQKPRSSVEINKTPVLPIKYGPGRSKSRPASVSSGNIFLKKPKTFNEAPSANLMGRAGVKTGPTIPNATTMSQFGLTARKAKSASKDVRWADEVAADAQSDATEILLDDEGAQNQWTTSPSFTCKVQGVKNSILPHQKMRDESEGGKFCLVEPPNKDGGSFHHTSLTLLSPCLYSIECLDRVEQWWAHSQLPETFAKSVQVTPEKVRAFGSELYEGTLELPFAQGTFVQTKASSQKTVVELAAMHFELYCDSMGVPLFPGDQEKQRQHADDLKCVGRWAIDHVPQGQQLKAQDAKALVSGDSSRPPVPKGLKEWVMEDRSHQGRVRAMVNRLAPLTPDEEAVAFHRTIVNAVSQHMTDFVPQDYEVNWQVGDVRLGTPEEILRQFLVEKGQQMESFYLVVGSNRQFRATIALPLPLARYGVRGGYAFAPTVNQAKALCAYNAIDVLCTLGVPIFSDKERQAALVQYRRERELCSGQEAGCGPKAFNPPSFRGVGNRNSDPTAAPPSRDLHYVHSQQFQNWTSLSPTALPALTLNGFVQSCYSALFGHSVLGPSKTMRSFVLSTTDVRWDLSNHIRSDHNLCWMRKCELAPGETHDELPLALGRAVKAVDAEHQCRLHFLRNCLSIRSLHEKFIKGEFVDEELLPKWFGRGDELKQNAQKMVNVIREDEKSLIPAALWNPDQHEEEMRQKGDLEGALLFHTVGFTERGFWDTIKRDHQNQVAKKQREANLTSGDFSLQRKGRGMGSWS